MERSVGKMISHRKAMGDDQAAEAEKRRAEALSLQGDDHKDERLKYLESDDRVKEKLLKKEASNFTRVYVMKNWDGWYKIYNNSGMIVSKYLDGRLGRRYEMRPDRGYGKHADYGAISIPADQVRDFIRGMLVAGLEILSETETEIEFDLKERVDQEEMVRMLHEDELTIAEANKLVMPKEMLKDLRAAMMVLLDLLHVRIRNQNLATKEVMLNEVEQRAIAMNKTIILTIRGVVKREMCMERVRRYAEETYADATTMMDMRLLTAKQYLELVNKIKAVENEVGREEARQKRTAKKAEQSGGMDASCATEEEKAKL